MDLLTLAAKITLDDSEYKKGVSDAESTGQKLAGKMSAATVAIGNLAAEAVKKAASAISGVYSSAIDGYADYQQLVGGIETLFKSSASKVSKYAAQSYKTTGLSANQYMDTVTSFSASLISGLKGDTEQAAEYANMAITDMADNSNKMGTDISSIQAAYQGFAKQNYTMLDNLKLGYGGTESEMVRLMNDSGTLEKEISDMDGITFDQLVKAINAVQTSLGITGTTAKEAADTISGSKNSLKASWADLMTAVAGTDPSETDRFHDPLGDALENFKTSFTTYVNQIVPSIITTIANSGTLVTGIAEAIASLPTDLLAKVGETGIEAGTGMVNGVAKITSWLTESIANLFKSATQNPEDIKKLGEAIGSFLGNTIKDLITYAPDILEGIISVGVSLSSGLIEGLFKGLFGEGAEVDKITEQLESDLTDIDLENAQATGILRYMDKLYEKYGNGVTRMAEWKQAQEELEKAMPAAGKVFQDYGTDIQGALDVLEKLNKSMRETAIREGIANALSEQRELYGEQITKAVTARTKAERTASKKEALEESKQVTAVAYAQELQKLIAEGADFGMQDISGMIENVNKTLATGETSDIALKEFMVALQNYYEGNGTDKSETVWGQNLGDEILDPETLEKFDRTISDYDDTIQKSNEDAEKWEKEAAATAEEIAITEATLKDYIEDQAESHKNAAETIDTEAAKVGVALGNFSTRLNNFIVTSAGTYFGTPMQEATGIDYVPYTGFTASLHKGEAILTKTENEQYQNGSGSAEVVGAIQSLRGDMQNLRIMVGKSVFGKTVVSYAGDSLNDYIGSSNSSYEAGYGT